MKFKYIIVCFVIFGSLQLFSNKKNVDNAFFQSLINKKFKGFTVKYFCKGNFTNKKKIEYAIGAVSSNKDIGVYFVYLSNGEIIKIMEFTGGLDLQCLTSSRSKIFNKTIQNTKTVYGKISNKTNKDIFCGFIDYTTAKCWGYDKNKKKFVKVGGWTT